MGNVEIKKLRKLLPLFEKFLPFWKDNMDFTNGICWAIICMHDQGLSTSREYIEMEIYFKSKDPVNNSETKFAKFADHPSFKGFGSGYWWTTTENGYFERTKFIEAIIEDIKEKLKPLKMEQTISPSKITKLETLLRLYIVLLEHWELGKRENISIGLCESIKSLYKKEIITPKEREKLDQDLFENKPNKTRYTKFINCNEWLGEGYWFKLDVWGFEYRSEFIRARIKDLNIQLNTIQDENK